MSSVSENRACGAQGRPPLANALGVHHWTSWGCDTPNLAERRVAVVRPGADLDALAAAAALNPGGAWLIGNEPNNSAQDAMAPP